MKLTITLDLDNTGFEENAEREVARILTNCVPRLLSVGVHHVRPGESQELFSVLDRDGYPIGAFVVSA